MTSQSQQDDTGSTLDAGKGADRSADRRSGGSGAKTSARSAAKVNALKASERSRTAAAKFRDLTARRAAASTSTPLVRLVEDDPESTTESGTLPHGGDEDTSQRAGSGASRTSHQAVDLTIVSDQPRVPDGLVDHEMDEEVEGAEQAREAQAVPAGEPDVPVADDPGTQTLFEPPVEGERGSKQIVGSSDRAASDRLAPAPGAAKQAARPRRHKAARTVEDLIEMTSGQESRLERMGEPVKKMTLELPIPLVDILANLELQALKSSGRRIYRERLFDMALAALPEDPEEVIEIGDRLPGWLKYAETEQVGARAREALVLRLRTMPVEMKVRRTKGIYLRYIYTAALVNLLTSYGVEVSQPAVEN